MRKQIGFIAGIAFGIALVATCGQAGDSGPMNMNGSGGDGAIAGDGLFGVGDAHAQQGPAMTGTCDQIATRSMTATGYAATSSYYYADMTIAGLDPTSPPQLSVIGCDYEWFGAQSPFGACPSSVSCSDSGYSVPYAAAPCQPLGYQLGNGRLIVNCGYKQTSQGVDYGSRARTVYVRVN